MTRYFKIGRGGWKPDIFTRAVTVVRDGGVIIFPTETVYGLGGNANNAETLEKIYRLKKRKGDKPLARLISGWEEIHGLIEDDGHVRLLKKHWPGPLTVIVGVSAGETRGYRVPDHDSLRRLIRESGVELAATSANRSGSPAINDGGGRPPPVFWAGGSDH